MAADISNASAPDLVGWTAGPETRGTLTLVWSCVITVFACTWTVLHLNVPGRDEGWLTILLRKIKWMAINILFPEFIFAKAICDLRLALEELRGFDENVRENGLLLGKWTASHHSKVHEWSWEFEYPPWAPTLYRMLRLTPPQTKAEQEQRPSCASKILAFLSSMTKSSTQADIEAQTPLGSDGLRRSNSQAISPDPEATSAGQDLDIDLTREQFEAGESQPQTEAFSVEWRTVQKWTVVHSYYAQMGGILYQYADSGTCYYSCTATMLTARHEFGNDAQNLFDRLILTEQDIKDKSKADWVLKATAVAQVSWLILSVIVRSVMNLAITQLEIATISYAVMALLSYAANWWKPKDISHATILQSPIMPIRKMGDGIPSYEHLSYPQSFMLRLQSPKTAAFKARSMRDQMRRVPNDIVWMEGDSPSIFILMAISSLGFGGLHCLAWYFEFPSHTELICWRVASVISAVWPTIILGSSLALHFLSTSYVDYQLVSILLRKLEPLDGLESGLWEHMTRPNWQYWSNEALSFLVKNPTGTRDWENEPQKEAVAKEIDSELEDGLDFILGCIIIDLISFLDNWRKARKLTPYMARTLREDWFYYGSEVQGISSTKARLNLFQDYEGYVKKMHAIYVPQIPDPTCIDFILRAYGETVEEGQRWERLRNVCEKASPIITVASGIVYTISRLVILVVVFTCLRETPAGVYQVTPWLNFLPNFS